MESKEDPVDNLLVKYAEIFKKELGTMTTCRATLKVREDANPKFCRPRPIPFAIKERVVEELNRLEKAGIIEKVDHSEWAAPIVPVPKKDGNFRICGDYKVTRGVGHDHMTR